MLSPYVCLMLCVRRLGISLPRDLRLLLFEAVQRKRINVLACSLFDDSSLEPVLRKLNVAIRADQFLCTRALLTPRAAFTFLRAPPDVRWHNRGAKLWLRSGALCSVVFVVLPPNCALPTNHARLANCMQRILEYCEALAITHVAVLSETENVKSVFEKAKIVPMLSRCKVNLQTFEHVDDAFRFLEEAPEKALSKKGKLLFPISKLFSYNIISGIVRSGTVRVGQKIRFAGKPEVWKVASIEWCGNPINFATAGRIVALKLTDAYQIDPLGVIIDADDDPQMENKLEMDVTVHSASWRGERYGYRKGREFTVYFFGGTTRVQCCLVDGVAGDVLTAYTKSGEFELHVALRDQTKPVLVTSEHHVVFLSQQLSKGYRSQTVAFIGTCREKE